MPIRWQILRRNLRPLSLPWTPSSLSLAWAKDRYIPWIATPIRVSSSRVRRLCPSAVQPTVCKTIMCWRLWLWTSPKRNLWLISSCISSLAAKRISHWRSLPKMVRLKAPSTFVPIRIRRCGSCAARILRTLRCAMPMPSLGNICTTRRIRYWAPCIWLPRCVPTSSRKVWALTSTRKIRMVQEWGSPSKAV